MATTRDIQAAVIRFCCCCNGSTVKDFIDEDCGSRDCHLYPYRPVTAPKKTLTKGLSRSTRP